MSNFIEIVNQYGIVQKEIEDYDNLIVFFSMFRTFNGGKPIKQSLVDKIEKFFDYRWKNDKRLALEEDLEIQMLTQLPLVVQDTLLSKFIFNDFLYAFTNFFKITQKGILTTDGTKPLCYFTWDDQAYRGFMFSLLLKLEPIFYNSGTIITNELEEFNEISFCMNGQCVIGYEINNQRRYCIKYTDSFVLGAYEMTFNKKSMFIYRSMSYIEGLFVRKEVWMDLINEY